MTGWLVHLGLSSAGLAAAGGVLRLAAALRPNDPAALYRLGVTALVVTLGLAAGQAAVAGRGSCGSVRTWSSMLFAWCGFCQLCRLPGRR